METPSASIESLIERLETYGKTTFDLTKLKILEKSSVVITSWVYGILIFIVGVLFTFFSSIGLALMLNDRLNSACIGFFIVAGFYLLAGALLYFFLHNRIKKIFTDLIVSQTL